MRIRKHQQRELFDEDPAAPVLPPEVQAEALRLLTQWLHALSKAMIEESGDEQDQR